MHLLYLDDSGSSTNKTEEYFVLGGVSLFEAQIDHITREMDKLAQSINASNPYDIEFHASEIYARRSAPWNTMSPQDARGVIKSVLKIFASCYDTARAFACAIHKNSYTADPVALSFEDLCSRFDKYLSRLRSEGDRQRGLLVIDESSQEKTLQAMAKNFRRLGTRWGGIHHIADIPLFVNSRASRAIQLADHVAYSVFRRYNHGDSQYLDIILSKFDRVDNVIHGLSHKQLVDANCLCPSCMSRL